jgi:serine/threonine-protein kinase HipA
MPTHDINEYVTMRAARLLGMIVADHEVLETVSGNHLFVSRRYDRMKAAGRWRRLHQEDICQALSVEPRWKYQSDGGPGVRRIAGLLRDQIVDLEERDASQRRFFDALVFAVASLGTDAHAKNYSLMLEGASASLAPLYDLGSFAPYRDDTQQVRAAMSIGDEYGMFQIGERQFLSAAQSLGLPTDGAIERVRHITGRIASAFRLAAGSTSAPFASDVARSVEQYADERGWSSTDL